MFIALQVLLAWVYSHVLEWILHRYILHNPKRKTWFRSHFGDHHKAARKYSMVDPKYLSPISLQGDPEIKGLLVLMMLHFPVMFVFPWAYGMLALMGLDYWWIHRKSHQDPHWARQHLPWHYDHHMAPDQHANWGVRSSVVDCLLSTRKKYKGSQKETIKHHLIKSRLEKTRKTNARPCRNTGQESEKID